MNTEVSNIMISELQENNHSEQIIEQPDLILQDPDIANSKGRTSRRYKTIREELEDKA